MCDNIICVVNICLTFLISRFVCSWSLSNSGLQSNVRMGTSCKRGGMLIRISESEVVCVCMCVCVCV